MGSVGWIEILILPVLEWWALFCFTGDLGFLTPARKQFPEHPQDVKLSTHQPWCGRVSDAGEWGLLWGTGDVYLSEQPLIPSRAQGKTGGGRALCHCSAPIYLWVISRQPWRQAEPTTPLSPSACCRLHSEAVLLWLLNRLLGGANVLQTERQRTGKAFYSVRLTAEWTWRVPTLNLSFLFYKTKAWTMHSLKPHLSLKFTVSWL